MIPASLKLDAFTLAVSIEPVPLQKQVLEIAFIRQGRSSYCPFIPPIGERQDVEPVRDDRRPCGRAR